ncbi:MAG: imidazole glycerol phosphate synthase subunit HisF [Rickettsiales bacterium]
MLKIRIIPCLDVKDGRVVKGVNFLSLKDAGDPVELAKFYNEAGADELCFLDITATKEKRDTIYTVVEQVASTCFIPLTVGGGVKSITDIRKLFLSGADKVAINSAAITNPALINQAALEFGSQAIVVAIDAKWQEQNSQYEIFTHGGSKETGIEAVAWAQEMEHRGAGELLVTSMDRDGTKSGFDNKLNKLISSKVNIPLIASGGCGHIKHFSEAILAGEVQALLAASIFHFGEYSIAEVKDFLSANNIAVRK